jgi:ubiquinone/menaquinone biosynthesis C-methylase UbiE
MWTHDKIKNYWKERADKGDNPCHYFNKWQDKYAEKMRLGAFKKKDLAGAKKVVDIGCGVGDYTVKLTDMTDADVVGFDFDFNIEIARKKYKNPKIVFKAGSVPNEQIEADIKVADIVILTTVYNHLTDDARNDLVGYFKIMKPGSTILMLEYFPDTVPEFQKGLGYKQIETWKQAIERFKKQGIELKEVRHVNYIDSFFFHHLGANMFSYYVTILGEMIGKVLKLKNSKYKLLVFQIHN